MSKIFLSYIMIVYFSSILAFIKTVHIKIINIGASNCRLKSGPSAGTERYLW